MSVYKQLTILFLIISPHLKAYGQHNTVNIQGYKINTSVRQNGCVFQFWTGISDSTRKKILTRRIGARKTVVLYQGSIRDGKYSVMDMNNDGYKDFVTYYHDFNEVYFFDYTKNTFRDTPVDVPITFGVLDSGKSIYWGYRDAQYSEEYDYSILYTYNEFAPRVIYKLVYKTDPESNGQTKVNVILLYRFKNGDYSNPVFVKKIKTAKPGDFNYRKYWKENWKKLTIKQAPLF
ncbi:hypothetical protein [Foetidibacter luteolus]|uniref:hypothetical protein n=1 Tax=Foetidibacter luteolus TaxID=2608880 RepID=UPI00129B5091|nr:hypothetical protein [Foetidibacter luteolus]